jgi:hypothetical protein
LQTTAWQAAILRGKQLLAERLRHLRLESVAVRDDGACQFRAISQQLYASQEHHRAIRKKARDAPRRVGSRR